MFDIQNKVALVTGASRGIGAQIARSLASEGAKVMVNYQRDEGAADEIVRAIRAEGGEAQTVKGDVSRAADVKALFDATIARFGVINVLINNAGVALYKRIDETTEDEFQRCFDVNVKGVFLGLREAAARMADGGRIVNVSSSATRLMMPTYGTYSSTKAAVEQMTRVYAKEIGARGITVNAIAPGPTDTELFLQGKSEETVKRIASMSAFSRIGEPLDIARVVLFLVSDEAAWITGQIIGVNGGFA